jgi:hypothetical protein
MIGSNPANVPNKEDALTIVEEVKKPNKPVKEKDTITSVKYPKMNIDLKVYKKAEVFNNLRLAQKRENELKMAGKECILYIKRRHKIELYIKR